MNFQHQTNNYFNATDLFEFELNDGYRFQSKCHVYNGTWYTDFGLNWKCTSIKAIKL